MLPLSLLFYLLIHVPIVICSGVSASIAHTAIHANTDTALALLLLAY